jgi:ArsR family transcriptional regulator, arsenate/arsenite/antimonite-responsive transcriptional repressor
MENNDAITRMAALATPSRLEVLQFLAREGGKNGLPSGFIAEKLGIRPNSLSTQMLLLSNARLVRARREGRQIIYSVNYEAIGELIEYLAKDCGGGRISTKLRIAA